MLKDSSLLINRGCCYLFIFAGLKVISVVEFQSATTVLRFVFSEKLKNQYNFQFSGISEEYNKNQNRIIILSCDKFASLTRFYIYTTLHITKVHLFLKQCLHNLQLIQNKVNSPNLLRKAQLTLAEVPCFESLCTTLF